jgi:hypothetical protein
VRNFLFAVAVLFGLTACTVSGSYCGIAAENFPEHRVESRWKYHLTGVMDTTTAIVEGTIYDIASGKSFPEGNILLTNEYDHYLEVSDSTGRFRFFHINAGRYAIKASATTCHTLLEDSLTVGSGYSIEATIGMGLIGKNDLQKTVH